MFLQFFLPHGRKTGTVAIKAVPSGAHTHFIFQTFHYKIHRLVSNNLQLHLVNRNTGGYVFMILEFFFKYTRMCHKYHEHAWGDQNRDNFIFC